MECFIKQIRRIAEQLASIEIWVVAALVAGTFVYARLLPVAVIVAGIFWIIRWAAYGRPSVRTPADWTIGTLVLMIPISWWITTHPEKTDPQILRLITGIALFYAIANWAVSLKRIRQIFMGVVLAGFLLSLFALVSVEWNTTKLPFIPLNLYDRFLILVEDTVNPNVMAGSLALFIPLLSALVLFEWKNYALIWKLLAILILLCMLSVLILTQARGAWMAVAVALMALAILRWRWSWIGLQILLIGAIVVIYNYGSEVILETLVSNATLGGFDGRVEVWSRAIYMLQDFPYTGVGMGTFADVVDLFYPFYLYGPGTSMHTHNLFFQIAVDLGILGLIAWLASFSVVIILSWKLYKSKRKGWTRSLGAGLFCSQLALITNGITDAVTWGMVRPAPFVWILWGMAVASWMLATQEVISAAGEKRKLSFKEIVNG